MNWPSSQDYNEAIQNAASALADPDLKGGQPTLNALGLPVPRSGNFADVYQFQGADGRMWAVKCFTRHVPGLQERYTKIDAYLAKARFPFTVGFKYLAEGIRIRKQSYPLLKMEWVEGFTLNDFVRQNAEKPSYLHGLMLMWAKLTAKLRDANIAHADLQHGNVLLVPGATASTLGLKLIDYDGMWVPPLADNHSGEVGHPNFQHPLRLKERLFNAEVDRFPHLVIACALRATLVGGKKIWDRFDNGDNLLFREADLRDASKAAIFKALWELNDPILRTLVGHIALATQQPLRKTPWLDDVLLEDESPRLNSEMEKQVVALLGVAATKAVAAPAPVREEFDSFEAVVDDDEDEKPMRLREDDDEERQRRARRRSRRKPKARKSNRSIAPKLIGGGVALLALIGVAIAMKAANKRKVSQPDALVAENDPGVQRPKVNELTAPGPAKELSRPKQDPTNDKTKNDPAHPDKENPEKPPAAATRFSLLKDAGETARPPKFGYSPDGKYLFNVMNDQVVIAEGDTGKELGSISPNGVVQEVNFGRDKEIYLVMRDGNFQCWDWEKSKLVNDFPKDQAIGMIKPLDSAVLGNRLLLCAGQTRLHLWDVANWREVEKFELGGQASAERCFVYAAGRLALVWHGGHHLAVWDLSKKTEAFPLDGLQNGGNPIGYVSPNEKWIVGCIQRTGEVIVCDARTGRRVRSMSGIEFTPPILSAGFTTGGNFFIIQNRKGRRWVLDLEKGQSDEQPIPNPGTLTAAFASRAGLMATADSDGRLRVWKMEFDSAPPDPASRLAFQVKSVEEAEQVMRFDASAEKVTELIDALRELSAAQLMERDYAAARKTIERARTLARTQLKDEEELVSQLDRLSLLAALKEKVADRVESAERTLRQTPDDPEANSIVGLFRIATAEDLAEAQPLLARSSDAAIKKLGTLLKGKFTDLSCADALQAASESELARDFKNALLSRAFRHYVAVMESDSANKEIARVKTQLKQLAEALGIEAYKEGTGAHAKLFGRIQAALKAGNIVKTEMKGGVDRTREFQDLPPEGALLVGLEISYGQFGKYPTVKSFRPIYLRANGSKTMPKTTYGFVTSKTVKIEAKPGYAVGSVNVQHGLGVDGLSLTFMEITDTGLNPKKSYTSEWHGHKDPNTALKLGSNGVPIVGIFGKFAPDAGSTFNGFGAILLNDARAKSKKP